MRKTIVGAMVSMDGVMQAPGGPTEDPTKGFTFGGWQMPYFDQEFREELDRLFNETFDLLLGRKTYEIFVAYWPYYDAGGSAGGIAKRFNEIRKYTVSRSGEVDTSWQGSVLLRAYKTPSVRNVANRAPYMHAGQTASLAERHRRRSRVLPRTSAPAPLITNRVCRFAWHRECAVQ
jgi:dihydrofolate reductase